MRFAPLLVAALLAPGCASGRGSAGAGGAPTVEVDGVARTYRIHEPPGPDRARPLPLLLVFHGAGSDADDMARGSGFDGLADTLPMWVVYPEALGGRFDVSPPAGRVSADVRFVDVLLEHLRGRYAIDPRRVYASGFSNGAAFCYRLAAERPDVMAAIAPVAGYLPALAPTPAAPPVPALHVHGTADRRVAAPPLAGGAADAVSAWARRNGATRGPEVTTLPTTDGLVVRRAAYVGATSRADTVLWLVDGADHTWPGGPGGVITRGILDFLRAHPR